MMGRPMPFDRRVMQERVIGQRHQRQPAGHVEAIEIDSHQCDVAGISGNTAMPASNSTNGITVQNGGAVRSCAA